MNMSCFFCVRVHALANLFRFSFSLALVVFFVNAYFVEGSCFVWFHFVLSIFISSIFSFLIYLDIYNARRRRSVRRYKFACMYMIHKYILLDICMQCTD